jgi:ABC-2 type transport system ATP-binding protein
MIAIDDITVARLGAVVLDRLSHRIHAGEAVAVIGPSGAGKSSLLETLATLLPLQSGSLIVDGHNAAQKPAALRRLIGYVPAGVPAWPVIRVDECLELFASATGMRGDHLATAVDRSLETTGLRHLAAQRIDALPANQSKRLLLARALLHEPPVLLLDNPGDSLDAAGQQLLEELVTAAPLVGRVIVTAFNDADIPLGYTELMLLHEGRLVRNGPCRPEAYPEVRHWQVRIDCPESAPLAARAIGHIATSCTIVDAHTVRCDLSAARGPIQETITALIRADVPVSGCCYDPPWPAQLIAHHVDGGPA